MNAPLWLGIDFGTSGVRAIAIDGDDRVVAERRQPLPAPVRRGKAVEQEAGLWWQGLERLLDALFEQLDPARIAALAVDGTSGTLLLCDAGGRPLGPALMYNDARAEAEARHIAKVAPRQSAAHGATSALAKLLHLKPDDRAAFALHQADWIVGRLTGRFGLSDENNCLKLGFDPVTGRWPGWLADLGVEERLLPAVHRPGTPLAPLAPEIARRFGLDPATRVVAGTTDSTAAFIATGAREVGDAVTSLGSTLVMKVISARPIFSPEHGVYAQPLGGRWLVGGGSNSGGAVLLHHFGREAIEAMTPRLDPDRPTGLDYYPLITPGERFPVADPALPPRLEPRPADDLRFFQAMLEGMARIEADGYRLLERLGAPWPRRLFSAGGGARNRGWSAIRARLMGVPMVTPEQEEAAYGAALLAKEGAKGV